MDVEPKSETDNLAGSKDLTELYRSRFEVPCGFRVQEFQATVLDISTSGSLRFQECVPVAPRTDSLILGIDFFLLTRGPPGTERSK